ncbi:MAG: sugar ABC transporter permease [Anaerolineae bacterium]|nr:sugar ABC transporter permease [Anaerolineae bacterium]MDQ7035822.1 sugar ABC transporter permease [Anaerolineae bacterium]
MRTTKRAHWHHLLIFIGPAVLIYSVFLALPLVDSLRLSLYSRVDGEVVFVGLQNFDKLLNNPFFSERFWGALKHNFAWFVLFMAIQNPVGLLLAALVSSPKLKGAAFYRTVIFTPTTMSIVIIGWAWTLMLNPLWGIVNDILNFFRLGAIIPSRGWLGSEDTALIVVILVGIWQYIGLPFVLFLASLTAIDEELIEAARVDGATGWSIFWRIKFPLILPTAGIVAILTFVGNFSAFDNVYVMQGSTAGPDYGTDLLGVFFYRTAFGTLGSVPDLYMGTTIATVMFGIILTGVLLYFFGIQQRLIRD